MKKNHPNAKVFNILWSHIPACDQHDYGTDHDPKHQMASHCTDIRYIFDTLHLSPDASWTDQDRKYVEILGEYMGNFLKTGDVNGEGLPYWPEAADSYSYLEVGDSLMVHTGLESKVEEMAREYVLKEYGIDKDL